MLVKRPQFFSENDATVEEMRRLIHLAGTDTFMMMLIKQNDGYILQMRARHRGNSYALKSEKARNRRVFKNPEAAFRICQSLGFEYVTVSLEQTKEQTGVAV